MAPGHLLLAMQTFFLGFLTNPSLQKQPLCGRRHFGATTAVQVESHDEVLNISFERQSAEFFANLADAGFHSIADEKERYNVKEVEDFKILHQIKN